MAILDFIYKQLSFKTQITTILKNRIIYFLKEMCSAYQKLIFSWLAEY
jgi:hypothetical protein